MKGPLVSSGPSQTAHCPDSELAATFLACQQRPGAQSFANVLVYNSIHCRGFFLKENRVHFS